MSGLAAPKNDAAWPLRGREAELAVLRDALGGRRRRSVVLVGSPGVGKTRLAREAVRVAQGTGVTCLWTVATHASAHVPYGGLAAVLPAVGPGSSAGPGALLHRSAAALAEMAGDRGLLLCVDDAHLLDAASASLVEQLVASEAVTIVATVRAREPAPEAITALWKDDLAVRIEVTELRRATIAELLSDVLGEHVDSDVAATLGERCGGNVLMLRELVRGALADGTLKPDMGLWRLVGPLRPSERLVEIVEHRLHGLSDDARRLLEVVAHGEPLGRAELHAVGDPSVAEGLERAGLVASEMSGRRCVLRPGHPIYGEVVRSLTPALRVATMARTLAESLEGCGARRREDVLRVGVWRLDGGGGPHDTMLAAADAARWRYDFALAERLARGAMSAQMSFDAALRAAECRALRGEPLQAERELRAMASLACDDAQRARLALQHIDVLWLSLGRPDEARRRAEQAEQAITDPRLREEVAGHRLGLLMFTDGPGPAAAAVDSLIERASARSLSWLGVIGAFAYTRVGRIADALDTAQRAHAAGRSLSTPYGWYPWYALYARCEALGQSGRYDEAWTLAQEQYDLALEAHSVEARAFFLWFMARSVHDRGDAVVASRLAQEGVALFRQLGYAPWHHNLGSFRVLALALAGQPEEAREAMTVVDGLDTIPEWSRCDVLIARAWVDVADGALERARTKLLEAAAHGESNGDLVGATTALHDVARLGRPRDVMSGLARLAERCEGPLIQARALHARALAAGDTQLLAELAERFAGMGAHLLAAETAVDVVRNLSAAGAAREEAAARQRAAVLRERCGVAETPALQAVDTRSLLTPAEYETALLAAAGRSNQAIAAELQLSVRTVGNRLQRVYEKLGISRRTDLGGLLH